MPVWWSTSTTFLSGIGVVRALNRGQVRQFTHGARSITGAAEERPMMTVFVYVDPNKQVGDPDHIKVFASQDAAETWLLENDPDGLTFEYEVLE
jgi:hypothetical protein